MSIPISLLLLTYELVIHGYEKKTLNRQFSCSAPGYFLPDILLVPKLCKDSPFFRLLPLLRICLFSLRMFCCIMRQKKACIHRPPSFFYRKKTQNHAKKPGLYFHIRGWSGYPVCACLHLSACVDAQADLNSAMPLNTSIYANNSVLKGLRETFYTFQTT